MAVGKMKVRWLIGIGSVLALALVFVGITLYSWIYKPALTGLDKEKDYLHISTGSDYEGLLHKLDSLNWLKNIKAFDWVAKRKMLPASIKPGRYEVFQSMSNDSLVNLLRSGQQSEVGLIFKTMRTFENMAEVVSAQIEADSTSLITLLTDSRVIDSLGFTPESWMGMFVPNTYRFFWNTNARGFINRMHREYQSFWNPDRLAKLKKVALTKSEIITLAAIVQEETFKQDEMFRVAGVYMNRLRKGIRLQADPTIIFAVGDPGIRRVLRKHLQVDSPYNTYKHKGLPPGPIRIPSIQAIDACLKYENHNYIYFCAKEDFSGYHSFASSYTQHLRNARRYRKALNERNIYN
ncbi:MAG: endolytic transglycosylase MltG [Bacteroidetes bacterium]|jgi:UPF0755 protein|nr:endolytic transglycosylase MltG [Bacteroidota bacterium]MBT4401494.1 endolytic transglycosylase MltG [Bacteroidota bacterium]MBT4411166.1 endolytic transglycosylase MltG [Bacteroidota bacterium]MBT5425379.1 endolytic transglycosylase MltG [Bacteroidota bacterium]MBT7095219.1 endolytic transglycosylase MltG [Bacteroidota bacterium]